MKLMLFDVVYKCGRSCRTGKEALGAKQSCVGGQKRVYELDTVKRVYCEQSRCG